MASTDAAAKKVSDYNPYYRDQGIDYPVAAPSGGVGLAFAEIAQDGSSPFSVTFADLGLDDMEDGTYIPLVTGPNGDERADLSTRTAKGFDIVGGADTELLGIVIVGRLKGQAK